MQQDLWPQAKRLYVKAMDIAKKNSDLPESWTATIGLCKCLEHEGKHMDAILLYRTVLDVVVPTMGFDDRDCISSRIGIVTCMLAMGDVEQAERECCDVLLQSTNVLGEANMHTMRAIKLLQQCRAALHDKPAATTSHKVSMVC